MIERERRNEKEGEEGGGREEGIVGEKGKEGWRGREGGREGLKLKILGDKNIH